MPRAIWIVRHANREDFVDPTWRETADRPHDPGLSCDGVRQAGRLARRLSTAPVTHVYSSPFLRAVQTAHPVAAELDRPVQLEPGLGEWLNPEWFSGAPGTAPAEKLARRYGRVDPGHVPCLEPTFPEGLEEAFERVGRAARCLADRHGPEDELLMVGHGATVTGVLRGFLDDVEDAGCPLCSVTRLVRRGGAWELEVRNDTLHLDGARAADRFH